MRHTIDSMPFSPANGLAIFGGQPIFQKVRPVSNLVTPEIDVFLRLLKQYHEGKGWRLVGLLEERLARTHGATCCVSFCNGLWGMVICAALLAKGEEVIMPSLTYRRLGDIAAWCKLVPHYCEVSPDTLTPTVSTVEPCINEKTGLILVTQSMTKVIDYWGLQKLAKKYSLALMVDSVEAGWGTYQGGKIGSFGDAECFSMHASKLINAFEGGYITTNNTELAADLKALRARAGLELSGVHAAMGLASLDGLLFQLAWNRARWLHYKDYLKTPSLTLLEYDVHEYRSYKNVVVRIEDSSLIDRDMFLDILHAENMLARPYYSPPLHTKRTSYPVVYEDLSLTETLSKNHMLLPCGDFVSLVDIERICRFLGFLHANEQEVLEKWNGKRLR